MQADNLGPFISKDAQQDQSIEMCNGNLLGDRCTMRLGGENRLKLTAASILATVALLLIGRLIAGLGVPSAPPIAAVSVYGGRTASGVTKNAGNLNAFDPTLRSDQLKLSEGIKYSGTGRNIFRLQNPVSRTPPGPKPSPPPPPAKLSLPTVRLRFFGFASTPGDAKEIFLSEDGDVFIGRTGDIINNRYKILQVRPTSVEMEDLINDVRQILPLDQG